MVATGSLSSKNSANISELLDHGFHPGSLLNDFDYWDYVVPEPNLNEVIFEETTCQSLAKMLENCLSKSKQTKLGCSKVLVPEKLTQRIAQDVLRLSSTEPCGLRGCVMHVNLEIENITDQTQRGLVTCPKSPSYAGEPEYCIKPRQLRGLSSPCCHQVPKEAQRPSPHHQKTGKPMSETPASKFKERIINVVSFQVGKMRKLLSIFTIHWSRAMLRTKNHSNEGAWMSQWLSVFLPSAQGLI
ncbi:DNA damage-inducible transcript 4-like protein isoform X1 [Vulpes vulpes]|uniref:DNA damage-inducible transcript 4-like protein n=1 Tax=Vulpes vulpes TaxID=9627 RepID=A0ABM5AA87_VULVU